jgi:protein translocase SecG subunit
MIETISNVLPYAQITISILLIISVLLQQTGAAVGAGGAFGGGDNNTASTRRGLEKTLLKVSIYLSVLFFLSAILALLIK